MSSTKNRSSEIKYFENQNLKESIVNNSTTSMKTRNLMLKNHSTESADLYAMREGTSDSTIGGHIERTTPSSSRDASRTSSKKQNHGTSRNISRAQLTGKPTDKKGDTGCSAKIQGD